MPQIMRIVAHRNTSGNISLRLRCLVAGHYYDIATGITLPPADWDNRRQRILPTNTDAKALNTQLDTLCDKATIHLQQNDADIDALRAALRDIPPAMDTCTADDLFDALRAFIATESRRNTWSDGTIKRFQSLTAALSSFAPALHLSTLSATTLDRYIDHRAAHGYNNTTIAREIKLLRWFLRWCADNGRYNGDLHNSYTPHLKGANYEYKEVVYLTLDELLTLERTPMPPYLANIRDAFCFCCFTGLRFSDVARLRKSDIHDNYIEIVTQKTDKRIRIDLNKHSAAILARHAANEYPDNAALPIVSNQHTNNRLKEICELCHIDEPTRIVKYSGRKRIESIVPKYQLVTTHCARRTFVVTALQLGIPLEVITRWTGHSDLKALKPYVAIVDELKAQNMAKFDKL